MSTKRPILRSKMNLLFTALIVPALLLAGCGVLSTPTATAIPPILPIPSPTPQVVPATQAATVAPATQAPLATPTVMPASPTPQATPLISQATPIVPASISPTGSITFSPGATAGVVAGTVQPGQVLSYTLGASAGQPMVLIMDSTQGDVTLGVLEANGNPLLNPGSRFTKWQATLPATELYTIEVIGGASVENFDLTIKIAQVVFFAAGTSSSTLSGQTVNGYLFDYALTCMAGQTMTASLNVPSTTAYLDVFGINTGQLLSDVSRATSWSAVLPQTQQYVVEVVPTNGVVINYTLTVSCTGVASNNSSTSSLTSGTVVISPGSTAAVKHGTVGAGQIVTYTVQLDQYQPMILNLGAVNGSPNTAVLGVLFPDGTTFLSSSQRFLNWQWRIPITGLYTIQVVGGASSEEFELTIKLPRIVLFSEGSNSISIKSATELGYIVSYAVYGNTGQQMTVSLNVSSDVAYLDIFGLSSGSLLGYQSRSSSWTGTLPDTEQYIVEVIPRGGQIAQYVVTITMQ